MAIIPEERLPTEISPFNAVEIAYSQELARIVDSLQSGLPVMAECEKELVPYIYKSIRDKLKQGGTRFLYLDGRPVSGLPEPPLGAGLVQTILFYLREAVRGAADNVIVLPHLDLLATNSGGLTSEAKEVISLLYENLELRVLGFRDPSFSMPKVIDNFFIKHETFIGIPREKLGQLVTQRESRKLSSEKALNTWQLYKHVSGMNPVKLRRLLSTLNGEDYPKNPRHVYARLRQATLVGQLTLPDVDLMKDIGGYSEVKERLSKEILDILAMRDSCRDDESVKQIEGLIPRGMIFWGPPGTGKTMFAKAMATSLGAAVTVVSGPELKSKWVGESEENLRQIFMRARQAAPAVIVFDEIDSFAMARGTYTGSGVEHSMVNQLLTEMDGFRKEELVFVVGTTNFVESLDPALLRPGRFEFHLHIPYPDEASRREIISIYNRKFSLNMSERALDYAVKRTGDVVDDNGGRFSGDHIQAMCRSLARARLRAGNTGVTEPVDVEAALDKQGSRVVLSKDEEFIVATHEAGHAIVSMFVPDMPPVERISIKGGASMLGSVTYADQNHKFVMTEDNIKSRIATLLGGMEAERLVIGKVSAGAANDLERATAFARMYVQQLGMDDKLVGVGSWTESDKLSEQMKANIEASIRHLLEGQRERCANILRENLSLLITLRDMLLEKKVIDSASLSNMGLLHNK
jgi:cell division protease FtsH